MEIMEENTKHIVFFSDNENNESITDTLCSALENTVNCVLKSENIKLPCEISISFVNDKEIRELNLNYRGKDKSTDVLSFPLIEEERIDSLRSVDSRELFRDDINPENDAVMIGDIIISTETAQRQAEEIGQSFEREIVFLTVHSILHLLGYDHEKSAEEEKIMIEKQKNIMSEHENC